MLLGYDAAMSDCRTIVYILVTKGVEGVKHDGNSRLGGVRYTRDSVRGLLQVMGCKPRHSYKVMQLIFQSVERGLVDKRGSSKRGWSVCSHDDQQCYVCMPRQEFYEIVCCSLAEYNYKYSPNSDELKVACSLKERRRCIIVLLAGTSGSGKSTLASILANRLGISTVLSTDSVRHMLRSLVSREDAPLLWASTYQAGDSLDIKTAGYESLTPQERVLKGYKAQCEVVVQQLDTLITECEDKRQSMVCEGVHLSINFVVKLMQKHPSVIPFLIYIKNENKHIERMAVRAKYMTLDPNKNRYVKNMKNIRWIQDYLVRKCDKHLLPKVENTNVDRSVGLIHLTVLGCLKRMLKGETMLDPLTNTVRALHAEFMQVSEMLTSNTQDMPESHDPGQMVCVENESPGSYSQPSLLLNQHPSNRQTATAMTLDQLDMGTVPAHSAGHTVPARDTSAQAALLVPAVCQGPGPLEIHKEYKASVNLTDSNQTIAEHSSFHVWPNHSETSNIQLQDHNNLTSSMQLSEHGTRTGSCNRPRVTLLLPNAKNATTGIVASDMHSLLERQSSDEEGLLAGGSSGNESDGDALPLQDYGSMYESATYDDMDEHEEEEEYDDAEHPLLACRSAVARQFAGSLPGSGGPLHPRHRRHPLRRRRSAHAASNDMTVEHATEQPGSGVGHTIGSAMPGSGAGPRQSLQDSRIVEYKPGMSGSTPHAPVHLGRYQEEQLASTGPNVTLLDQSLHEVASTSHETAVKPK